MVSRPNPASISLRLHAVAHGTCWDVKIRELIRPAWIKWRIVGGKMFHESQLGFLDAFNDAPGEFIAAVIIMMRAVLESEVEVLAERTVQFHAGGIQVNACHAFLMRHFANGLG